MRFPTSRSVQAAHDDNTLRKNPIEQGVWESLEMDTPGLPIEDGVRFWILHDPTHLTACQTVTLPGLLHRSTSIHTGVILRRPSFVNVVRQTYFSEEMSFMT